jgi:hypothetical protein
MIHHVFEVLDRTRYLPAIDRLRCFAGVLEGNTEVSTTGTSRFGWCYMGCCVTDLVDIPQLAKYE